MRAKQANPLTIRCTDEEKDLWRRCAEAAGMSTNAWCKAVLNTATRTVNPDGKRCSHPEQSVVEVSDVLWCQSCGERV